MASLSEDKKTLTLENGDKYKVSFDSVLIVDDSSGNRIKAAKQFVQHVLPIYKNRNGNPIDSSGNPVPAGGKRNKTKKNKQEGGKRKLSGYMKFANKMRPQLMKDNPGMKVPQMGKKLGEMWGKLSDSEKKSYA
jgi:hypothetical protein